VLSESDEFLIKKTLIISQQGIGNNLLALPLADAIYRQSGQPVVMLIKSPRAAPLLLLKESVSEVIAASDDHYRGPLGSAKLILELRRRRFDRAIFAYPSGRRSMLIATAAGIRERIGLVHRATGVAGALLTISEQARPDCHDLEQNVEIARMAGADIDLGADWPTLKPSWGNMKAAAKFIKDSGLPTDTRYLGIHPGSDADFLEKRWPEDCFAAAASEIYRKRRLAGIVFDGPAEAGSGKRIAHICKTPVLPMDGWGDMPSALGMLAFCDIFLSNDSGLMNLAAAAGVPTVAVFGPSDASRTRPYGHMCRTIIAQRPCVPCYDMKVFPGCLYPDHPCMLDISPAEVAKTALEIFTK
jgi:lipopolysaccharide heptosyltransferase II